MKLFLRAKHWQLFIFAFGISTLLSLADMLNTFSIDVNNDKYSTVTSVFSLIGLFGWMYSVAVGMQKMVPATAKMKVNMFKVFFVIPIIYIILIFIFIDFFSKSSMDPFFGPDAPVVVPVLLFSMFCMLYCFYFVAKTIKTVELQRAVTFGDFVLEFFLIWFFPIGLWILQPRINRMVTQYADSNEMW